MVEPPDQKEREEENPLRNVSPHDREDQIKANIQNHKGNYFDHQIKDPRDQAQKRPCSPEMNLHPLGKFHRLECVDTPFGTCHLNFNES
jgi:hypothetical protein